MNPKVRLGDGESTAVQSANPKSNSTYTIKRTGSSYLCSCPAWRNQKGISPECRTCKHLKELLGTAFEEARVSAAKGSPSQTVPSTGISKKRKNEDGKDDEPAKKQSRSTAAHKDKPVTNNAVSNNSKHNAKTTDNVANSANDILANINGISAKVNLARQESIQVKSESSDTTYTIKRVEDHYYCTCPAWRNQSGPANLKTCKHLRNLLGTEYESARTASLKFSTSTSTTKSKPSSSSSSGKQGLLLAEKWDMKTDPTGYWISEKLDGVRALWNGKTFLSREGNEFTAPEWFTEILPTDIHLDGELYAGRGNFQDTVSIVRTVNSTLWPGKIQYQVFDIVDRTATIPFEERISQLQRLFAKKVDWIKLVDHEKCRSKDHLEEKLEAVLKLGGEGLMLREAKSVYVPSRSRTLYKVKTFFDAEAIVVGYEPGKGRNKGVCGALKCKLESGKEFKIGTGLSDAVRENPPKVGAIVNYKFQELSRGGIPRFPSFVGERADMPSPKDAVIPGVTSSSG